MKKIGVLALQGAFAEHICMLQKIGAQAKEVRLPAHLEGLDGLIIPGGESTAISKLAASYGLIEPLRVFGGKKPIWGTCAGAIFLAKKIISSSGQVPESLALMDMTVERNAFGRQVDSFEEQLSIPELGDDPYNAVFIRAPMIAAVDDSAQVLARINDGRIVAAQQGHLLATSFHPELTTDTRFHSYFLQLIQQKG